VQRDIPTFSACRNSALQLPKPKFHQKCHDRFGQNQKYAESVTIYIFRARTKTKIRPIFSQKIICPGKIYLIFLPNWTVSCCFNSSTSNFAFSSMTWSPNGKFYPHFCTTVMENRLFSCKIAVFTSERSNFCLLLTKLATFSESIVVSLEVKCCKFH